MRSHFLTGWRVVLGLVCLPVLLHGAVPILTTTAAVRALTPEQAGQGVSVHLTGVVTFYDPRQQVFFFQDETGPLYLDTARVWPVVAGSRVELWGTTSASYTTQVEPTEIHELSRGALPKPTVLDFATAARHENDCRFVTMEGVVRSSTEQTIGPQHVSLLELEVDHQIMEVAISKDPHFEASRILDAKLRVTGNLSGNFNKNDQIMGLQLMVTDSSEIEILSPPAVGVRETELIPLGTLLRSERALMEPKRVRTEGILTLYDQGERLVISDGANNLLVQTRQMDVMAIGQHVEVTGFPGASNGSPDLRMAQAFPSGSVTPQEPVEISFAKAITGKYGNSLVALDGELVSQTSERHLDTLTLRSGNRVFQAVFRKQPGDVDPIPVFALGTRLRVAGVCLVHVRGFWGTVESFQLHLRGADDIRVIETPTWWTVRHMLVLTLGLLGLVVVVSGWALLIRRRLSIQEKLLRQKIESEAARLDVLARLERQRGYILELVNSFEPLPEVFSAIHRYAAEMWPGMQSYAHLLKNRKLMLVTGEQLSAEDAKRLADVEPTHSREACAQAVRSRAQVKVENPRNIWSRPLISSHGELLGTMTFEGEPGKTIVLNQAALDFGCNLGAIAIDNRRLYEGALYRSQHDQLTGLPNRALLDEKLEEALHRVRGVDISFGFVAILFLDLDEFKAVNDTHSHRIGDMYLCEVASRFQGCLRECDVLGRVGGDEFIVAIVELAEPGQALVVAQRLVEVMHTPVIVEGIEIWGSVSVGLAIYPESGTTGTELKQQADAAMYAAKRGGGNRVSIAEAPGRNEAGRLFPE